MYIHIYIYICISIYLSLSLYLYIYIYIYTYAQACSWGIKQLRKQFCTTESDVSRVSGSAQSVVQHLVRSLSPRDSASAVYTRLVSSSVPTWSSSCCLSACHFWLGKPLGRDAIRIEPSWGWAQLEMSHVQWRPSCAKAIPAFSSVVFT